MREQAAFLDSGGERLWCTSHEPDGLPLGQVLMCAPLFEERKAAHRTLVETARALASTGFRVLRFDYRGCGDSGGEFTAFSVEDWVADIALAWAHLRDTRPGLPSGFLGLRLGAAFACRAAAALPDLSFAIAWEPVADGRRHLDQELRRKLVQEMMTGGHSRSRREALTGQLERGEPVDFDGYALTPRLYRDLCALTPDTLARPLPAIPILLTTTRATTPDAAAMADALARSGCRVDSRVISVPPFWGLLGLVDTQPMTRTTIDWILGIERGPR